jgi:hypothetical protein
MARDLETAIGAAFGSTHPDNPLRRLNSRDRKYLFLRLKEYAKAEARAGKGHGADDTFEKVSSLVIDAKKIGERLEAEIFKGPYALTYRVCGATVGLEDVPKKLSELSSRMGDLLDANGKHGHKRTIQAGVLLVEISEFVRIKTGRHNDDHLSELFQGIEKHAGQNEVSGTAIRKRRARLKREYPWLYTALKDRVQRGCDLL